VKAMPKDIQSGAVQLDADVCNAVDPPTQGCHAGGGIHLAIPSDWQARIAAGQQVPGCTYYTLFNGDELAVSDLTIAKLAIPAIVNALSAPLKAQAALLNVKLATAQVVT